MEFVIENESALNSALSCYKLQKVDFADALSAAVNASAGCVKTISFDKSAVKTGLMVALP
jgi:predicted nucleic-acid-binding protein